MKLKSCRELPYTYIAYSGRATGRFATLPVRHMDVSLPPQTLRYLDVSPPGCFAPLDVSIPGRFASSVDVSPPDNKEVLTVSQITNFQTGGETSLEVAKRAGIETSKGANPPGGELAK